MSRIAGSRHPGEAGDNGGAIRGEAISVVLATDLHVYAEGLARLLHAQPDIRLCGTASSPTELLRLIEQHQPDIALIDLAARQGHAAARVIAAHASRTRVVGFGLGTDEHEVVAAAEAGLAAYVMRDASFDELLDVVRGAVHGLLVCSPRMAAILNARVAALSAGRTPRPDAHLTPRELEIAQLIDQGFSNKQIARRLELRVPTVKNHVHNILEKLSVRTRSEVAPLLRGWIGDGQVTTPHWPHRPATATKPALP